MYTMGTLLRHGSEEQKANGCRRSPAANCGCRRSASPNFQRHRHSSLKTFARREGNDSYIVNGQKIWTSRAEYSDLMILLARTTPKTSQETHRRPVVFIVDMRAAKDNGLSISPIRTMMNHSTTEVFFTDMRVPAET